MVLVSPAPIDGRDQRVLDAAAELFAHHGYDKTTVDDVARRAGLSKGSVYLAFDGKAKLFEGVLITQMRAFVESWTAALEVHPRGGTLGAMYGAMIQALDEVPFMAVVFRRDPGMLGRYLQQPGNFFEDYAVGQPTRHEVIEILQRAGSVRADVDPKVVAHIMNMFSYGLVFLDQVVDPAQVPPTDDVIRGMAEFMDRAFTPEDGGDAEAGKAAILGIMRGGVARFDQMLDERRAQPSKGDPTS